MVWVAPKVLAISSLLSRMSAAMILLAPDSMAPCTAFSPTPPQPITSTVEPASILAWRVTAPTPVATQQPTRAACGHGMSLRIGTTISSGTTTSSAKVPMRAIWLMSWPLCLMRKVPS